MKASIVTVRICTLIVAVLLLAGQAAMAEVKCTESYAVGNGRFSLATGSPGELGMLKVLGEAFSRQNQAVMCWVKAGSGESLKMLKGKEVDMIMVHAPAGEKQAISEGWAIKRELIGSNEFYIVGPKSVRPASARPPARPTPTRGSPPRKKSSIRAATIPAPTKKSSTSGRRPPFSPAANGTT